jgi:deazaflavin-dependent oxidoreductase (nitroreductase family)
MVEAQKIPKGLPNIVRYFSSLFKKRMIADVESGKSEMSIISHTGRKSGRAYRTPVEAIFLDNEVLIGLVYGRKTDWLKNVLAQGGCSIFYKLQMYTATDPIILPADAARKLLPPGSTRISENRAIAGEYLYILVKRLPADENRSSQVLPA